MHPKPARARAEDRRGAKAGIAETRPLGRPCPRGLPPSTSHGAFPEAPLQPPRATHRHSSSTLSSCRLLDCTPWARAAASRLRLLLRLLPPAAARRPDKRAEGDSGRGGPRSKGSLERDGSGCQESRRAQSGAGSGADARHSAGVGLRAAGLRGGRDHCGCTEGGHSYGREEGPGRRERHRPGLQQCSGSLVTHSLEVRTSGLWPHVQSPGRAAARVPPRTCAHWLRLGRACAFRACSNESRAA